MAYSIIISKTSTIHADIFAIFGEKLTHKNDNLVLITASEIVHGNHFLKAMIASQDTKLDVPEGPTVIIIEIPNDLILLIIDSPLQKDRLGF